jgi:hypothetical protein
MLLILQALLLRQAQGIVLSRNAGLGEGVEEGRFADVGQADDA